MGSHSWRLVTNYNYNILYILIYIYINIYKFCVHVFCMCEGISFFCCHCHHLAFFICKSLNINTLKNHSFTFLTKTVIIFVIILPPKSLGLHALGEICSMMTKTGRNRKIY